MFLLCKPAYTEEEIIALQIFTNTHQVLLVVGGMDDLVNWGTLSSTEVGLQKSTADTFHPDCHLVLFIEQIWYSKLVVDILMTEGFFRKGNQLL